MTHRRGNPEHPDYDPKWRGPNGRRQCRRCLREVPKGRRTFCSDDCVRDYQLETGSSTWVRDYVHQRDHGVCASCGLDTDRLRRVVIRLARWIAIRIRRDGRHDELRADLLCRCRAEGAQWLRACYVGAYVPYKMERLIEAWLLHRFGWSMRQAWDSRRSYWQADHIVPLVEGGGFLLDNLRTLCVPCHSGETAALAARQARKGAA